MVIYLYMTTFLGTSYFQISCKTVSLTDVKSRVGHDAKCQTSTVSIKMSSDELPMSHFQRYGNGVYNLGQSHLSFC